jgi:hypothetical protein
VASFPEFLILPLKFFQFFLGFLRQLVIEHLELPDVLSVAGVRLEAGTVAVNFQWGINGDIE